MAPPAALLPSAALAQRCGAALAPPVLACLVHRAMCASGRQQDAEMDRARAAAHTLAAAAPLALVLLLLHTQSKLVALLIVVSAAASLAPRNTWDKLEAHTPLRHAANAVLVFAALLPPAIA